MGRLPVNQRHRRRAGEESASVVMRLNKEAPTNRGLPGPKNPLSVINAGSRSGRKSGAVDHGLQNIKEQVPHGAGA